MEYDINCSIQDVEDYISKTEDNIDTVDKAFFAQRSSFLSDEYGGVLGEIYYAIKNQLSAIHEGASQSLDRAAAELEDALEAQAKIGAMLEEISESDDAKDIDISEYQKLYDKLQGIINNIKSQMSDIKHYIFACGNAFSRLTSKYKYLAVAYNSFQHREDRCTASAERAKEYVQTLGSLLVRITDGNAWSGDKIKISSPDVLRDFSETLNDEFFRIQNLSGELLNVTQEVSSMMQDNVISSAAAQANHTTSVLSHLTCDFPEKSKLLLRAAKVLSDYSAL